MELLELLDAVHRYSVDFGVKFSADKSQVIVVNGERDERNDWRLGNITVKRTRKKNIKQNSTHVLYLHREK